MNAISKFQSHIDHDELEAAKAVYDAMDEATRAQALRSIPVAACIYFCDYFKLPA